MPEKDNDGDKESVNLSFVYCFDLINFKVTDHHEKIMNSKNF